MDRKEYAKKYYIENKEKMRKAHAEWRKNNPEYNKRYYKDNIENARKWEQDNKISRAEYKSNWRKGKPWLGSYWNAKKRCTNKDYDNFHRYGGRGIIFDLSMDDMELLWNRDKAYDMKSPSIDRVDNDGNYELSNCRFIEQAENTRRAKSTGQR